MPKFNSKEGQWFPADEKVAVTDPKTGEPVIYEGPDREAVKMLKELGEPILDPETGEEINIMGQHFTNNTDMFELARSKGYESVEDYVTKMGYDKEKALKIYRENKKKVNTHQAPERHPDKVPSPGGVDTASGKQIDKGDFGDEGKNLKA